MADVINLNETLKNKQEAAEENIVTSFGCRLNQEEGNKIKLFLKKLNINNTIVINTCTVTTEAERQCLQYVRNISKKHPSKEIIVTGCSAQLHAEKYTKIANIKKFWAI